jgi:hypothetical protein
MNILNEYLHLRSNQGFSRVPYAGKSLDINFSQNSIIAYFVHALLQKDY